MTIKQHIEELRKNPNHIETLSEQEIYMLFDYMEAEQKRIEERFEVVTRTQRPFSELILKQVLFTELANN